MNKINNTNEILITSANKPMLYRNFNEIDFTGLGNSYHDDHYFLSSKGIVFEDYLSHYLTGNDLIFYPELTIKLREVKDYPTLKCTFEIDETLKGMEFIEHFYQTTKKSYASFQREHETACKKIKQID